MNKIRLKYTKDKTTLQIYRLGDNTNIEYRDTRTFCYLIMISRTFSSYRDIGKSRLKKIYIVFKKNLDCESSQKFHGNKMSPVFSSFGSEKQKRTTAEVQTNLPMSTVDL